MRAVRAAFVSSAGEDFFLAVEPLELRDGPSRSRVELEAFELE